MSSIEWTNKTWNPTTGCDRTTPGCDRCYALTMAKRLKGMGSAKYQTDGNPKTSGPGFGVAMHETSLPEPLRWKKPARVFVNSMSDLFHAEITNDFIARVFAVMALTPQHTYQILTKRHGRMRSLLGSQEFVRLVDDHREWLRPGCGDFTWPLPGVWLGVSVEDQKRADLRIPALLETPAALRFLSCEPLLGPVDLFSGDHTGHESDYDGDTICLDCSTDSEHVSWRAVDRTALGIDWLIVGGESGPGARPMDTAWVASLIKQGHDAGAAVFVKQLGSVWAKTNAASDTKGGKPDDWPAGLRIREYPTAAVAQGISR